MMTMRELAARPASIPTAAAWLLADLERACPGVSRDMIRKLLRRFQAEGTIECVGRGPGARWRKRVGSSKEGTKEGTDS